MKDLLRMAVVLVVICVVAALALSQVYKVTKDPIAQAKEAEAKEAAAAVLSAVVGDGVEMVKRENVAGKDAVYVAQAGDAAKGFAFKVDTNSGYSGKIVGMIGLDADGNILGFKVVEHSETPGLGANIAVNEPWQKQLIAKDGQPRNLDNTDWRVKKDGGEIDALTGATISPRAICGAIKAGLEWFRDNRVELTGNAAPAEAVEPTPDPNAPLVPTPDATLEEGGTVDKNLPAAKPLPTTTKTPLPIQGKDLTE